MVFSSNIFLFGFLPLVLSLYFLTPSRFRNTYLFVTSLLFYFWGCGPVIFVYLLCIVLNHYAGHMIHSSPRARAKTILTIILILDLAILIYYKYFNFFSDQVYHKTDFHWSDPAGAYMAKALVDTLGNLSGKGNLWDFPIRTRIEKMTTGGENESLGLLWPIREDALYLSPERNEAGVGEYSYTQESNDWTFRAKPGNQARLLPCTVMFGDSYADAFSRAGFTAYFSEFHKFFNWEFPKKYSEIPEGTRFVIFQHIEPFLNPLLNPSFWPDEIKDK
jgi:hypothetical protein